MLCFPVSALSRLVVSVLLPAVWSSGGRPFRLCGSPPPVCVCVRVRVCCLLCPVPRFGLALWPCSMFSFLPFASRATTLGQVSPYSWSTYDRYATAVVFAGGGWLLILLVVFPFRSLLSFPPSRALLPSDSKKEVPWRESHCFVLLRRDEAGGPCSGVRTDDLWLTSPGVFAQEHAVDLGFKSFVCYLLSSLIVVAFLHEPSAGTA